MAVSEPHPTSDDSVSRADHGDSGESWNENKSIEGKSVLDTADVEVIRSCSRVMGIFGFGLAALGVLVVLLAVVLLVLRPEQTILMPVVILGIVFVVGGLATVAYSIDITANKAVRRAFSFTQLGSFILRLCERMQPWHWR